MLIADQSQQDSLEIGASYDIMQGEQTWPTEEELNSSLRKSNFQVQSCKVAIRIVVNNNGVLRLIKFQYRYLKECRHIKRIG